jgi:hypothetical protein
MHVNTTSSIVLVLHSGPAGTLYSVQLATCSPGFSAPEASFVREGHFVDVRYSTQNLIDYELPRRL